MAKKSDEPKAANDAYTGMLAISLIALIVGCVLLYLDYSQYGAEPPPAVPSAPAPQPAPQPPAAAPAVPPNGAQPPQGAVPVPVNP